MAALLVAHHRPGFYFRVLEEGEVGAGDEIVKVAEGPERLTVAAVDALLYLPGPAKEELERALRIPALSPGWKSSFEALLRQMTQPGSRTGNAGLTSPEQMRHGCSWIPASESGQNGSREQQCGLTGAGASGRSSSDGPSARAVRGVATPS